MLVDASDSASNYILYFLLLGLLCLTAYSLLALIHALQRRKYQRHVEAEFQGGVTYACDAVMERANERMHEWEKECQ